MASLSQLQGPGYIVPIIGVEAQELIPAHGTQDLGFRIWGLGFRISGLGFRI